MAKETALLAEEHLKIPGFAAQQDTPGEALDPQSRYLFLFAHPDDEVLIAGTMRGLLARGAFMHAAWVTSGDYFGGRERREAELASAMGILGLDEKRTRLLRLPSLGLLAQLRHGCERVAEVMNETQPDIVFVNAYEGGHPDHDAVNFMAYAGLRELGPKTRLLEFPLYNGTGPFYHWRWRINSFPPGGPRVLHNPLDSAGTRCKYRMMRAYSSQWAYMIPAAPRMLRARMRHPGEPYRCCPEDRDHVRPPCSGKLNYERWFNWFLKTRFVDFREAVRNARDVRSRA